ncbi:MAG: GNAT family N-acetyltransferase [Bacilli bacterium]|nr:GNAT family N-acetyltransferase [Bacilli bacterium]
MIEIRKAYGADAYQLVNITDTVWKDAFYDILPNGILNDMIRNTEKRISHLKDQINENNRIFVATSDEVPIGYIFYAKTQNVIYNAAAEIRSIYILPEFQHQGIGRQLFNKAIEELKKLGYKNLIIYSPLNCQSINFFLKMRGEKREVVSKNTNGYNIKYDLIFFDLENLDKELKNTDWNDIYLAAQEHLYLLNNINRELAVIMTDKGNMYLGLGIKNHVCPIESALANMHIKEEQQASKILILNRQSKPVLPCGKCRDLLIGLKQENAEILFDFGTLKTMTMHELNPYYKDEEEKV